MVLAKWRKTRSFGILLTGLCFCFSFTGCVMKSAHYKSFLDLRNETSKNLSQQILDAVVAVCDLGEVPVLFSVESGTASWQPTYTGGISTIINPLFRANASNMTPSISGSETRYNAIQFNDFGTAAMSRATLLYGYMCFPVNFGEVVLPHGALYTIVDISGRPDGFLFYKQLRDGRYMGVPESKREEFIRFSRDITYWTPNAEPDTKDLMSVAGSLYRFSVLYGTSLREIANAVVDKKNAESSLPGVQKSMEEEIKKFEELKEKAQSSQSNPAIMQTLLQMAKEDVDSIEKGVGGISSQITQSKKTLLSKSSEMNILIASFDEALKKIQEADAQVSLTEKNLIIQSFSEPVEKILAGDETLLEKFLNAPDSASSLDAKEPVDELYRERFESLPSRYDPLGQGTQ